MPSVRIRITILAAIVVSGALAAGSYVLVKSVRSSVEERIESSERQELNSIAAQVAAGTRPEEVILTGPPVANYAIVLPDGTVFVPVLASTARTSSTSANAAGSGGLRIVHDGPDQVWTTDDHMDVRRKGNGIETVVNLPTDSGSFAHVRSVRNLAEITATVNSVQHMMWLAVPLVAALVALLTWFMTGRALAPVAHIREEVDEISRSTLHRRVPVPNTDDEIARLARTMNSMLERLDGAAVREREFLSDASHELRSPIASLGATLEVALRNSDTADWEDVARRALEDQQRLGSSVDALVTLSSLSEMQAAQLHASQQVDLDDLVLEVARRPGRVPVSTANVSAARVNGRPDLLERLVRNLVDNAQRHADTRVQITVQRDDNRVVLMVDDDGNGVAEEDCARIFDRFTRLDEGRSRDRGGTGLGLAMVASIAERHGGTARCEASPLGGARFVVELPTDYQGIATPPLGRKI